MTVRPMTPQAEGAPRAVQGHGVAATWWYTFGSVVMFVAMYLSIWAVAVLAVGTWPARIAYAAAALVWTVAFVALGIAYRHAERLRELRIGWTRAGLIAIGALAAGGVSMAVGALTPFAALSLVLVCLLPWPRGIRARVTALCTILIVPLAWIDAGRVAPQDDDVQAVTAWFMLLAFAVVLPFTVVSMLWWWDIVRELDRARAAEARLAATQERLRLAGDVHDLQGHHLQVIALQLELAERLLHDDPGAALPHLRAAQRSVDDARSGTRELATRFRGVPLPDELANAADLLRAAGLRVELRVSPDAADAPQEVLGPVVRESTTNILKHGGGRSATLSLDRGDRQGAWLFRALNDVPADAGAAESGAAESGAAAGSEASGSGLSGMAERVAQAGGSLRAAARGRTFELVAEVPHGQAQGALA
ncbi:sensor histidine kinase [Microbacterium marinilacus]|uniref:Signal transduction histidine kinase subgroup 3 dimerisation and phosphoacceptor domain-containing protein n=1 Tax=Microbacterium marinilacus TaxID=415209 RepID=A0ABP7BXP3_9MICO|nr:histidine kinase [Microbacterium marinilacus]MBY0688130.1 sensor histidine kinase [Microbacterium marinilacus]